MTVSDPEQESQDPYDVFYAEVAARQLADWLPSAPTTVLDLSGGHGTFTRLMLVAGHDVVRAVADRRLGVDTRVHLEGSSRGRLHQVAADTRDLSWVATDSVDCDPGGEPRAVLLAAGRGHRGRDDPRRCARAAGCCSASTHWCWGWPGSPNRAAGPSSRTRRAPTSSWSPTSTARSPGASGRRSCATLLEDTGLKVEWIRPRSVLSKEAVVRALASDRDGAADPGPYRGGPGRRPRRRVGGHPPPRLRESSSAELRHELGWG